MQDGRQAIHYAAGVGNVEVVKLLIERFKVSATAADKVPLLKISATSCNELPVKSSICTCSCTYPCQLILYICTYVCVYTCM